MVINFDLWKYAKRNGYSYAAVIERYNKYARTK